MIFTSTDYQTFYIDGEGMALIDDVWKSRRLLAIGFGFSDPFLTFVASKVSTKLAADNRHFALIGHAGTSPISPIDRRQLSRKFRLTPIFYTVHKPGGDNREAPATDHSDLLNIL